MIQTRSEPLVSAALLFGFDHVDPSLGVLLNGSVVMFRCEFLKVGSCSAWTEHRLWVLWLRIGRDRHRFGRQQKLVPMVWSNP